ncbi:hypothetical protein REPUB_Repub16aG0039400 [Reevesia pubescens]
MTMFALAIYGLVIFPRIKGYIKVKVLDFFAQVKRCCNPAPSILTETFMSLNYCRQKEGNFVGCSSLLYVWLKGHFECTMNAFSRSHSDNHAPIREFRKSQWPEPKSKNEWLVFLRGLSPAQVKWIATWMKQELVLYQCGEKSMVPLLGLYGATCYAPLLALKQHGIEQFVPSIHGL